MAVKKIQLGSNNDRTWLTSRIPFLSPNELHYPISVNRLLIIKNPHFSKRWPVKLPLPVYSKLYVARVFFLLPLSRRRGITSDKRSEKSTKKIIAHLHWNSSGQWSFLHTGNAKNSGQCIANVQKMELLFPALSEVRGSLYARVHQGANYKKNIKIILRCDNNLR